MVHKIMSTRDIHIQGNGYSALCDLPHQLQNIIVALAKDLQSIGYSSNDLFPTFIYPMFSNYPKLRNEKNIKQLEKNCTIIKNMVSYARKYGAQLSEDLCEYFRVTVVPQIINEVQKDLR